MSWLLGSFLVVALVLGAGWLAYERSRPSARMVAIVGTMAAVAALGRDAFVAIPDVKPITAVTLLVGYSLGPLPGFTVGAIGMLASNILLGQGPYTPWQMAAWGMVGLLGALLARLSRRRLGRLSLGLACAASALAAKEIMNIYQWTLGASHTAAALALVAGQGLPFDLLDTASSFLFGAAFGPELARILGRVRGRLEIRWGSAPGAGAAALLVLLALSLALIGTGRARAADSDIARAAAFLEHAQNRDGGLGAARGHASAELYTAWGAIGLAAAGRDPAAVRRGGRSLLNGLAAQASTLEGAGDMERTVLALRACGAPATALGRLDPLARVLGYRRRDGSFQDLLNITAFAVFALRAAGRGPRDPVVRAAAAWIARQQDRDGGFGYGTRGGASDVDDTAAALQAVLDAARPPAGTVRRALRYLAGAQEPSGGFPEQAGGPANAQSTAWAVQALVAAGRDPGSLRRTPRGRTPIQYLQGLEAPNGSVRYSAHSYQTPVWVTAQVLTALARKPFPIAVPRR